MGRSRLDAAALIVLFIAALLANRRLTGPSPIVWVDTFNDETEVQQCLVNDSCTLTGVSTSVTGQAHAVAWLELRTLLAWLGVDLDGAHAVMQVLNALAAVLVFHLATQLGGPLAGAAAMWIFMDRTAALVRVTALHNSNLLLFLGTVFVLACTAVVQRPGIVSVVLAALVAAVMANVHLACVLTGASVVWVALTAPRRRLPLAAGGAAVFVLATFLMAPPTWLRNLTSLLQHRGTGHPVAVMTDPHTVMMAWTLFAVCAWMASFAIRAPAWVAYRRHAHGAIAVIVPFLAAFLVAPRFGLNAEAKYLCHLKAACAVAAALPLAAVAGAILRALPARLPLPVERTLPFALALVIALPGLGLRADGLLAQDERTPTVGDLEAVARILHDEHGWDAAHMVQYLKTPYGVALLSGLRQTVAGDRPNAGGADGGSSALLMVLEVDDLPDPLPSGWTVVRRSARSVTVLMLLPSRIDWGEFEACVQPAGDPTAHCDKSGWRFDEVALISVANLPPAGGGWRGTLELSLPLRPAASGLSDAIFMPRLPFVCGGRIAFLPVHGAQVDPDGRHATIPAPERAETSPSRVTLQWRIGAPECDVLTYDGLPPFFVEGDAATVRLVEAILRRREAGSQ